MLNVEEHHRSLDEGEAGINESGPHQHGRDLLTTNIRQSVNFQRTRNPFGLGRIQWWKRLCKSRLHMNQRPLEPEWTRVEKPCWARHELPPFKQKVQGLHHRHHPLAAGQKHQPPEKQRLDQRSRALRRCPPQMDIFCPRRNLETSQSDWIQKSGAQPAHSGLHQSDHHHRHRRPTPGQNSLPRKLWGDFQNRQGTKNRK